VNARLRAVYGDIVSLDVEAVVNAANATLLGGGGVDGAIHDAAGPELFEACQRLGGCEVGDARITAGYRMKAQYIIHAVGPIWRGGSAGEADLLASAYRTSLDVAAGEGARSVAFPSISTGIYGYPVDLAAAVALQTVDAWTAEHPDALESVTFVLFSSDTLEAFERASQA